MAKLSLVAGSTSKTVKVFIQNNSVTTGAGLTGLAYNTSGITAYYIIEGQNSTTAISLVTATLGTWTSGGFIVVDGINMPGVYELGIPNAALASGKSCIIFLQGAANMAPVILEIELTAVNNQSTGFGLVNASANVVQIAGSAVSTSTAQLGVNVVNIDAQTASASGTVTFPATVASATNITAGTITTVTNLTNAPTSGDFTSAMKTSIGTAVAASAVASVTGNVGGNVNGSVASVTNPVGITSNLKYGSTFTIVFPMFNSSTGAPQTGLIVSGVISKNTGSFNAIANSVTEIGDGFYYYTSSTGEATANNIALQFTSAGASSQNISLTMQP